MHLQKGITPRKPAVELISAAAVEARDWQQFHDGSTTFRREMQRFGERSLPSLLGMKVRQLPEEADELGAPMASFHIGAAILGWLICGPGCILMGLCILSGAIAMFMETPRRPPQNPAAQVPLAFFYVAIGAPLIALGLWYMATKRIERRQGLWVCADGIVWEKHGNVGSCRWHEIESFAASNATGALVMWLTPVHGIDFAFWVGQGPGLRPIADYVERKASGALLPIVLKRIFDGEKVQFGDLSMDRHGVYSIDGWCPWGEVEDVRANAATFEVDHLHGTGYISLRVKDVAFPMVAQAIFHILSEDRPPHSGR